MHFIVLFLFGARDGTCLSFLKVNKDAQHLREYSFVSKVRRDACCIRKQLPVAVCLYIHNFSKRKKKKTKMVRGEGDFYIVYISTLKRVSSRNVSNCMYDAQYDVSTSSCKHSSVRLVDKIS